MEYTEQYIEENADIIDWEEVSRKVNFKNLSEEFIFKFHEQWCWEEAIDNNNSFDNKVFLKYKKVISLDFSKRSFDSYQIAIFFYRNFEKISKLKSKTEIEKKIIRKMKKFFSKNFDLVINVDNKIITVKIFYKNDFNQITEHECCIYKHLD